MSSSEASGAGPRRRAQRRKALAWILVPPASLVLAGCGFQLRGAAQLPFESLYASFAPSSAIGGDFRRMVRVLGGTRLVDRPEDAQVRLDPLYELREKEIVGFSSTGRPREYQLRLRFSFKLTDIAKGVELIPATEILLRREITTTDTQLVAKEQEEALLYREMQTDMVQQLLRRLAALKR
ncbi:MAG TPA: LPS assembly lipoprotein LptE [Burkholderiaceae bacterium]|jgi:LPS-assembly lipoprotein|nr:LPS assembly lipoprotein LptE [Burkholderiaceae bacterium]